MKRALAFVAIASALMVGAGACGDDGGTAPPADGGTSYASLQAMMTTHCGGCHGDGSGRTFLVSMDSAALVASGLIDGQNPDASLLLQKPTGAVAHGGGGIAALTPDHVDAWREWIARTPALGIPLVTAYLTDRAPVIDGHRDEVWFHTPGTTLRISGGWADASEVTMKALYDATYLYVYFRWYDDRASRRRDPWVKQADGSWKVAAAKTTPTPGITWADYMGASFDEEGSAFMYEDKFAVAWNTYGPSTTAGFDQAGCAVVCHDPARNYSPGTTYNYTDQNLAAKKYTNAAAEIIDLWHWKLVRQNHNYKVDDQYARFWMQGTGNPGDGGRASDAGSGGYRDNPATTTADGRARPTYRGATIDPGPFYIQETDTVRLTDAELDALPVGAMIPNMLTKPPTGVPGRADLDGNAEWEPTTRTWTLEIRRRLVTGDSKDVQFDNLMRQYAFGLAVFDNAQIEHSWTPTVARLRFER